MLDLLASSAGPGRAGLKPTAQSPQPTAHTTFYFAGRGGSGKIKILIYYFSHFVIFDGKF